MLIQRELYLQRLIARRHNGMVKVITGIRRSGKSFLLFEIFKQYLLDQTIFWVFSWIVLKIVVTGIRKN